MRKYESKLALVKKFRML